jgi:thiamine-monophosphate kinase
VNKEEYFLEKYLKPCAVVNKQFPLEIGDDCAVISLSEDLLISSDNSVVDVHFPNTFDPYFIAYRSVAIAASDIIAMGAYPEGYLLNITLPEPSDQWFKQFSSGISDFNNDYGTNLIGGDLTKGQLNISVTVFGKKFKNIIKRGGAEVDDEIYVSNAIGYGKQGYELYKKQIFDLPNQYLKPKLLSKEAIKALNPILNSAIDVSDGLLLDLNRICEQSQKGAVVSINDHVFTNSIEDVVGGDDYVLLFTCPSKYNELVKKILPNSIKLGSITQEKEILVTDKTGKNINFKNLGWDSL